MKSFRHLLLSCVALLALLNSGRTDEPARDEKGQPPKLPTEAEIMAAKLKHAQTLIDAITREDFKKIEENAIALTRISNGAEFLTARKTDEYAFQARSFRESVTRMAERARTRNIDGVMLAYMEMSHSCLKCHQHTRDKKRD